MPRPTLASLQRQVQKAKVVLDERERARQEAEAAIDIFAELGAWEAFLRGEGPRPPVRPEPPCPPGIDPDDWRLRMKLSRCMEYRMAGELAEGEYLPDMTADEKATRDEFDQVFAAFREDVEGMIQPEETSYDLGGVGEANATTPGGD